MGIRMRRMEVKGARREHGTKFYYHELAYRMDLFFKNKNI